MAMGAIKVQGVGCLHDGKQSWQGDMGHVREGKEESRSVAPVLKERRMVALSSHHVRHEELMAGAHVWLKEKPCKSGPV